MNYLAIATVAVLLLSAQYALAAEGGNAQTQRMSQCSKQAKEQGLKGDARKEFMSQCLRKPGARAAAKECRSAATDKGLKGAERKTFVNDCIRSKEGAASMG